MPGGVAPKFAWLSEKVSRYTGVSQLQLRVSRYTVQLRLSPKVFPNLLSEARKSCDPVRLLERAFRAGARKPLNLLKSPIFANTPCKSPFLYNAPSVHTVEDRPKRVIKTLHLEHASQNANGFRILLHSIV